MSVDLRVELTLLDLMLVIQEFTRSERETVAVVSSLLDSGHVRFRSQRAGRDTRERRTPASRSASALEVEEAEPARMRAPGGCARRAVPRPLLRRP